jgi:gliding motility-associated protein GldM
MKKTRKIELIVTSLILVFLVACNCEKKRDSKNIVVAVDPIKMNVLYAGVDNPLSVVVSGYEVEDINIIIPEDQGKVNKTEPGYFIVHPIEPGSLTITVKAKEKTVHEKVFRVKTIPEPFAAVAKKSGGLINKNELLKANKVDALLPDFDFDVKFAVTQFTISKFKDENYYVSEVSESNKITDQQKELIRSSPIGTKITFENIEAIGPDGSKKMLYPIVFKLQ